MKDYKIPVDGFALEEWRRRYCRSAEANSRIAVLHGSDLPFEIARLAVEDPNVEVRQWFARYGSDYREILENVGGGFRFSDRDLLEILRKDSDEFVRACVYANPAFDPLLDVLTASSDETLGAAAGIGMLTRKYWSEATHLERLGMVRNKAFTHCLVDELKENATSLGSKERRELIWAFLAGRQQVLPQSRYREPDQKGREVWKIVVQWPEETDLQALVCRLLPVDAGRRRYGRRDLSQIRGTRVATSDPIYGVGPKGERDASQPVEGVWIHNQSRHQRQRRRVSIFCLCGPAGPKWMVLVV